MCEYECERLLVPMLTHWFDDMSRIHPTSRLESSATSSNVAVTLISGVDNERLDAFLRCDHAYPSLLV